MPSDIGSLYLDEIFRGLRGHKRLADEAIAQLSDEQFFALPDLESNSVAIIVKHMAGNLRSRFTDFLASDGEKPDRNRDQEFIVEAQSTRDDILRAWEQQWQVVFDTVRSLQPGDLERTVTIRGQPHSVVQALQRAAGHLAYHTGQIVQLSRYLAKDKWTTLTIPRGGTKEFNEKMGYR